MQWYMVGVIAALLTTFGFVPQILKMIQTKSVKDISLITLVQFSLGVALWTVYGLHLNDWIIIVANAISLIIFLFGVVVYYRYRKSVKTL